MVRPVILASAILFVALPGRVAAQDFDAGIAVGAMAQPITLPDLDGKPVDLSAVIGKKPVLLEFWATWCPLCRALMPRIDAARTRLGDKMEFIAIGVGVNQTPTTIKRHLAQHPIPLKVVYDGQGAAVRAFDAPATSFVVVLDAHGRWSTPGRATSRTSTPRWPRPFPPRQPSPAKNTRGPAPPGPVACLNRSDYFAVVSAGTNLLIASASNVYAVGSLSRNGAAT